ncbi:hypothetical protein G4G31_09535 [Massilia sp. Se16.2.3]|nr:hypothetical protein [Massilia sp. Se16.2.3]QNA99033.1 hypothetical protein G4G31_09535 [Massilia sp. Se16.2.3]
MAAGAVVAVAHIGLAAAGAAGTAHFQQPVAAGQHGMPEDGLAAALVGDGRHARLREIEPDGFGLRPGLAADRQDALAVDVVAVGTDPFPGRLARHGRQFADPGQQGGKARVLVVIGTGAAGHGDLDQRGRQQRAIDLRSLRCLGAVGIAEAAYRTVDVLDAAKAGRAIVLAQIVQAQAASLRIGHAQQDAAMIVLEGDELSAGREDLHQLSGRVETQLAAVRPAPHVFLAARGGGLGDAAVGGIGTGTQAGVARIAVEDQACTVGLHHLQGGGGHVQLGLVGQLPAASQQVRRCARLAVGAVVVAHDFQSEYARQRRHVHFALVFVAVDDVDGIAGTNVQGIGATARGRPAAAAGVAPGSGTASARRIRRRQGRGTGDAAHVGRTWRGQAETGQVRMRGR